jgi:ribonuclease T
MSDADLTIAAAVSAACASTREAPGSPGGPAAPPETPQTPVSSDGAAAAKPELGSAQASVSSGPVVAIEPAASGTGPAITIGATPPPAVSPAPPVVANGLMARRFRGFLPVVIDVETGGFHSATDALLEIAAVLIDIEPDGRLKRGATHSYHVKPFEGARLDPSSLSITGIDPFHPLRPALPEKDALGRVFREIRHAVHAHNCRRAVLVGHNAAFDLGFLNAAVVRAEVKRNPFHPFSCFDTATLAGAALGQTVLAKALAVAGLEWDPSSAHSASYDAERTADIFCLICNRLHDSFRDAQDRARSMGWFNAAPAEAAADEPPL